MKRIPILLLAVFALAGCKSAEQLASENASARARLATNTREFCVSLGYAAGSVDAARCAEGLVKKIADEGVAATQAGAIVSAAQARNRVSCSSYGNTVNCY